MRATAWIAAILLLAPLAGAAETLTGKVVSVADGDTITILVDSERVKVRLAEIDAPERGQPWGRRAKQALTEKIAGHVVQVETEFNDRYGRRVGHVSYSGRDINRELVSEGHAWVYRQWLRDQTLLEDEAHARAALAGLWGLPASERVPPWEWRATARARRRRVRSRATRAPRTRAWAGPQTVRRLSAEGGGARSISISYTGTG